jgi:hypothetical protein
MTPHSTRAFQSTAPGADVLDALRLALLIARLQSDLYSSAVATVGFVPTTEAVVITSISQQEAQHVILLTNLITGRGATAPASPVFDFTAKGAVPGFVFSVGQYDTFRILAQAFEDLSVRAYKGQVPALVGDTPALNAALTMHTVEARHAAEIRRLRGLEAWITGSSADDLPAWALPIYAGENVTTQGTVDIAAAIAATGGADAASQAFDEPLTSAEVTAILTPFIV